MIPRIEIDVQILSPLPQCAMPTAEEIREEGFGGFRGTWFIGRVSAADVELAVREEARLLRILDSAASSPEEFEERASAIEANGLGQLSDPLRLVATERILRLDGGDEVGRRVKAPATPSRTEGVYAESTMPRETRQIGPFERGSPTWRLHKGLHTHTTL